MTGRRIADAAARPGDTLADRVSAETWNVLQAKVAGQQPSTPAAGSPQPDFPLVKVTWVDAHNNQGAWMTESELGEFAKDEAYRVTQVGYKVYDDELCIVLAARLSTPSPDYGQSFGMCERIPKRLIDSEAVLEREASG